MHDLKCAYDVFEKYTQVAKWQSCYYYIVKNER